MVKIEKIKETKEKISFIIRDSSYSFVNSLRRSIFEIPVLAIEDVEFAKNDSALYDEMLAHRLGLIPLKAPKSFTEREDCSCKGKGCLKCTASFKLKATGPSTIYSKDLKGKGAEIVFKEIPIVILAKDQELELTAEAILGKGKNHAKFSPGIAWFNSIPIINLSKETESYTDLISVCPKKAIIGKGNKIEIDPLKCDLCEACIEYCNKNNKKPLDIAFSEKDFIFNIETFGQMEPKDIFLESVEALDKNLDELEKAVDKAK
jgi:DNA-directed RNA polymerase subunit D